jgi:hypothetical protein
VISPQLAVLDLNRLSTVARTSSGITYNVGINMSETQAQRRRNQR